MSEQISNQLKASIESGDFEQADALAKSYGESIVARLRAASSSQDRRVIANEATEFLQERLHLARVMRAHIASQLSVTSRLSGYADSPLLQYSWTVDG